MQPYNISKSAGYRNILLSHYSMSVVICTENRFNNQSLILHCSISNYQTLCIHWCYMYMYMFVSCRQPKQLNVNGYSPVLWSISRTEICKRMVNEHAHLLSLATDRQPTCLLNECIMYIVSEQQRVLNKTESMVVLTIQHSNCIKSHISTKNLMHTYMQLTCGWLIGTENSPG